MIAGLGLALYAPPSSSTPAPEVRARRLLCLPGDLAAERNHRRTAQKIVLVLARPGDGRPQSHARKRHRLERRDSAVGAGAPPGSRGTGECVGFGVQGTRRNCRGVPAWTGHRADPGRRTEQRRWQRPLPDDVAVRPQFLYRQQRARRRHLHVAAFRAGGAGVRAPGRDRAGGGRESDGI